MLPHVPSFVTDAAHDDMIPTQALIENLQTSSSARGAMLTSLGPRSSALTVTLPDRQQRTIFVQHYPDSAHTVSLFEPEQLAQDVESWLAQTL